MTAPEALRERIHTRRQVGRFVVHALQAGAQRLDGGAMFGVVPKTMWETRIAPDERNRIQMGMRCLLVEHDDGLVLIDTGAGNKESERFKGIYAIENAGADGRTWLEDAIIAAGFRPGDIKTVINTHLHFDHAGGNTFVDPHGAVRVAFPNARYVVQRGEYEYATHTNERTAASYFARNWDPVIASDHFDFIDGEPEIVPGIAVRRTPGHTPHHQSVVINGGSEVACFLADLIPTSAHVPLAWIMGYDVEPLVTLESKRTLLTRAAADRWLLIFEHDATNAWGYANRDAKNFVFERST
jgi:glyoxylase-like metal-dependent hydrolase (beta-lactamase superfamily II)